LVPTLGYAQTYFEPCATALSKLSFKALAAYLTANDNLLDTANRQSNPGLCFRLNDHEFLVLPKGFGIYHCEFKAASGCAEYESQVGSRWEMPYVSREFTDKAGKHFVLLKQTTLVHGIYGEAYFILYLLPPSKETNGFPFTIQSLVGASTNNDSGSLTQDDPCGWSSPDAPYTVPRSVSRIDTVSVGNDQEGNATLMFQMTEKDCDSDRMTKFRKKFAFKGGGFLDVSTDLPKSDFARIIRPQGLTVDGKGNLFVAVGHAILKVDPRGKVSLLAGGTEGFADGEGESAKFSAPSFLALAPDGSVLVSDARDGAIRRVTQSGRVSTMPGGNMPQPDGKELENDHLGAMGSPEGIAVDRAGNIFAACDDHSIRKISPSGAVSLVAGGQRGYEDGPGKQAKFSNIDYIALGLAEEVYVGDRANRAIRKVVFDGTTSTLIQGNKDISFVNIPDDEFFWAQGLAVAKDGSIYASSGNVVFKISPAGVAKVYAGSGAGFDDGTAATAHFNRPASLALDGKGNLFVIDEGNEAIREVWTDGRVTTVIARRRVHGANGCCQGSAN
jgi:sugar lactone lactonase YvrE